MKRAVPVAAPRGEKTVSTFPSEEIPEIPLNESQFASLIEAALHEAIRGLADVAVETHEREIVRPRPDGFGTEDLLAPSYNPAIFREAAKLSQLPAAKALNDYVWSHGQFRKTITRDDKRDVPRSAWERAVWGELIHSPLQWLLFNAALEELVATGTFRAWSVDPNLTTAAAKEVARRIVRKRRTIHAHCLLGLRRIEADKPIELEPGMTIEELSTLERCVHLTKYSHEYSSDDYSAPFFDVRLNVTVAMEDLSDQTASVAIANAIDRAKWALSIACNRDFAVEEGPVVIRSPDGSRCRTLRRDTAMIQGGQRKFDRTPLTADQGTRAAQLLNTYRTALGLAPGLSKAMWLFGRACTTSLARDSLLDAVIGLDSLLVPGGGEGRYRVALHGAALLGDSDPDQTHENLQKIYDLRSRAAHSAAFEGEKFQEMAPIARSYLARVIYAIAALLNCGAIQLKESKDTIANAVERWVRARVTDAARGALNIAFSKVLASNA